MMITEPKVTIIMPVYNLEKYLVRSIDSVLNQTYKNIELIVVNDGSTDDSQKIINSYIAKNNNIFCFNCKNSGVFKARLYGVSKAKGEYICFIDGDDYMDPEMIDVLVKNAYAYKADISHCGYKMVFPDGRIDEYYGTNKIVVQDNLKGVIDLLQGEFIEPGVWNKLYKIELFGKLQENSLDFSIKINEDLLMNYFLFKSANCSVYQDKTLYYYILRQNSATTSQINLNKLLDPIKVLNIIIRDTDIISVKNLLLCRKCRQLIKNTVICSEDQRQFVVDQRNSAIRELRKNFLHYFKASNRDFKIRLMLLIIVICPKFYQYIYVCYQKITNIDKKYDIS